MRRPGTVSHSENSLNAIGRMSPPHLGQWRGNECPHPGHELGPGNLRGVVRAGLLTRVTAASRAATVAPMPAGGSLALLADIPDRQCRDGPPEPVIRHEQAMVAVPVLPRWRHEIREPEPEADAVKSELRMGRLAAGRGHGEKAQHQKSARREAGR